MLARIVPVNGSVAKVLPAVVLASPDADLNLDLERILRSLGLRVEIADSEHAVIGAIHALAAPGILLLDVRLTGVANGQLLAIIHECGLRRRCAIALIAEQVSDEWIARLREGVIDDIVPMNSDAPAWNMHISTMQRGHQLSCELEHLRETALMEVQHDSVTGVFNRETMLSILFRETDRVQRLRGTLCVVAFDVDDFGHWIAELGTEASDALLLEIARRAGRTLRTYDLLGRSGRDEFMLALPGCSTINAVMLTERLRLEVFDEPFLVKLRSGDVRQVKLSACFGITSSRGRSPVVVVREAEETVMRARSAGPDSIRCASDSPLSAETSGATAGMGSARLYPGAEVMV